MNRVRCAAPLHVPRPAGPWRGVQENLARLGNALVYTTWSEWLPSVLTTPRLRELLGRDWHRYRRTPDAAVRYRFALPEAPGDDTGDGEDTGDDEVAP